MLGAIDTIRRHCHPGVASTAAAASSIRFRATRLPAKTKTIAASSVIR